MKKREPFKSMKEYPMNRIVKSILTFLFALFAFTTVFARETNVDYLRAVINNEIDESRKISLYLEYGEFLKIKNHPNLLYNYSMKAFTWPPKTMMSLARLKYWSTKVTFIVHYISMITKKLLNTLVRLLKLIKSPWWWYFITTGNRQRIGQLDQQHCLSLLAMGKALLKSSLLWFCYCPKQ